MRSSSAFLALVLVGCGAPRSADPPPIDRTGSSTTIGTPIATIETRCEAGLSYSSSGPPSRVFAVEPAVPGPPAGSKALVRLSGSITCNDPSVQRVSVRLRFDQGADGNGPFGYVVTGPGKFEIQVPPGSYWFEARPLDRWFGGGAWWNGVGIGTEQGQYLPQDPCLFRAGLFTGSVRDPDGEGIAGARVSFGDPIREGTPDVALTDAKGRFEIWTLGSRTVIASEGDGAAHRYEVLKRVEVVRGGETVRNIVLPAR